jgi:ribonuclease P protein component
MANQPSAQVSAYVLASKKGVDKRAVLRNRAKRRLRVAQRLILETHPLPPCSPSVRWVIMAGRGTLKATWPDILKEVENQWLNVVKTLP